MLTTCTSHPATEWFILYQTCSTYHALCVLNHLLRLFHCFLQHLEEIRAENNSARQWYVDHRIPASTQHLKYTGTRVYSAQEGDPVGMLVPFPTPLLDAYIGRQALHNKHNPQDHREHGTRRAKQHKNVVPRQDSVHIATQRCCAKAGQWTYVIVPLFPLVLFQVVS